MDNPLEPGDGHGVAPASRAPNDGQPAPAAHGMGGSPAVQLLWRVVPGNWPLEFVSDNAVQVLGYAADDLMSGRVGWRSIFHADDVQQCEARARQRDDELALEWPQEYRLRTPGGDLHWLKGWHTAQTDATGAIIRVQAWLTDITEYKRAQQTLEQQNLALRQRVEECAEELRQTREDMERAQEVGQIGWWRLNIQRNVLTWSDESHRIFGVPLGTPLTYETFLDIVHPDDRAYVDAQWQAALRGQHYDIEHRVATNDQVKWVREKAYLEFDNAGALLGGFGISQDITLRKLAEERVVALNQELQRRAAELQTIFDTVPIGLAIADDPAGQHIRGNPTNERMVGVGPGGQLSKRGLQPAPYRVFQEGRELPVDELPMQRAARGETVVGQLIDVLREDGELVALYSCAAPLTDEMGHPRGAVGAFLDITPLIRARALLRKSEEQYRSLFNSMTEGFAVHEIITDDDERPIDYRFLAVNPAFEQLTGLLAADVLGRRVLEVLPGTETLWIERYGRVALTGEPSNFESYSAVLDRWYEVFAYQAAPRQFAVIFTNITERKQAEERIRASLAEKEVLLKEIHHRVKNNMQVLSSLVSLQAERAPGESIRGVLREVAHRVRSMALVHEKLYQSTDLARVEFAEYVRSLLNYLWRAHADMASGIRLALDLTPVPLSVNVAVPCGLILNELVSNSLKHAFRGGREGEVAVALRFDGEGHICLRIADNGIGLPPEVDWHQTDSLGLQLVHMLAGQLHATVEVTRSAGTAFTLTFGDPAP